MPIMVAVDNSAASGAAIRLAAHEARCRQTDLLAVTAYRAELAFGAPAGRPWAVCELVRKIVRPLSC